MEKKKGVARHHNSHAAALAALAAGLIADL